MTTNKGAGCLHPQVDLPSPDSRHLTRVPPSFVEHVTYFGKDRASDREGCRGKSRVWIHEHPLPHPPYLPSTFPDYPRAGGAVGTIQQLVQQLSLTTCTVPALALPDSSRDSDLPTSSRGAHAQPPLVTYDGACLCAARPSAAGPSAARHHLNLRLLSTHATVSFRRLMGGDGVDTESGEGDTKRLPTPHPTSLPY